MSNSLRSNSAIFMLNTKSQSLSTFTNLFRLPPPGYTLPASNILHKLTPQPFEINCRSTTSQPFLKSIHHIISLLSISSPANSAFLFFSVADKGESEGEQRPSIFSHLPNSGIPGSTRPCNCERVPPRIFSHLPNSGTPGSTRPCNCERVPLGWFSYFQI